MKYVLDAIATGQFQATGVLQDMGADVSGGRAVAIIDIADDTSSYNLPGGSAAQVALYTPYAHHFAIIRRILLRMRSWQIGSTGTSITRPFTLGMNRVRTAQQREYVAEELGLSVGGNARIRPRVERFGRAE